MRIVLGVVTAVAISGMAASTRLACGDKYLVPGRGARFERTPAERQLATVLFYAPPSSALSRTLARLKAEAALRKAGYRPTVATGPDDLARVAATSWDVVLADAADGNAVKRHIPAASRAHVVAVLAEATGVQFRQARSEFPLVLKAPSRNQDFLDALDDAAARAFDERVKAGKGR